MARSAPPPGTIDVLVQGALVDLFNAYGVALAPTLPSEQDAFELHEVTAMIGFARAVDGEAREDGRLTLSMPSAVLRLLRDGAACPAGGDDWARELTNQLMGRIKNRLLRVGIALQIGLPVIGSRWQAQPRASTGLQLCTGATPGGDVLVTLEGMPKESELSGSEPDGVMLEGDALFF